MASFLLTPRADACRPGCSEIIVELERLLSQLGPSRPQPSSSGGGAGPTSEARWRRAVSINMPNPAKVVDSVQDMTSKTLSRFARGSPERTMPFTPRHRGGAVASTSRQPTSPVDVPDACPVPGARRTKPRIPLAQGPASLPVLSSPFGGMSPVMPRSPAQRIPRSEQSFGTPVPEDDLTCSVPGSTGSIADRRKRFLNRFKWRGSKHRSAQQLQVNPSFDSAMF